MASGSATDININLAFPKAGVVFVIEASGPNGQAPAFRLRVTDSSGNVVPITREASEYVHDWIRGYTRWLYRARVTASWDVDGITGTAILAQALEVFGVSVLPYLPHRME